MAAVKKKPVGTVWFAFASVSGEGITRRECFSGDRESVRRRERRRTRYKPVMATISTKHLMQQRAYTRV